MGGGGAILVTGVPRSGTTWLARLLAQAPGTALSGREPMNPRGRQYALGGTLHGWTRLTRLSAGQRRRLALAYRGLNPLVYSRYGSRQWAAPLPRTRVVVKDPFAMLSIPAIREQTRASVVLVYRHPGAVLTSYRRVGWTPDLGELQAVIEDVRNAGGPQLPDLPLPGSTTPAEEMGRFWSALHDLALADTADEGHDVLVVPHEAVSTDPLLARTLVDRLGLGWSDSLEAELSRRGGAGGPTDPQALHNFDRAPAQVAQAWRARLSSDEIEQIEEVTASTRARLHQAGLTPGETLRQLDPDH